MITLAFAQMMYYVFVSMKSYGGDDGLSLPGRSTGLGLELRNDFVWYYLVLVLAGRWFSICCTGCSLRASAA